MTIVEAMRDRALFGPWFDSKSWHGWAVFLAALFGLPISDEDLEAYQRHSGRTEPTTAAAREAWVIVGRRGGKSRIAALIAVYLACFRDHSAVLAPGEVGTLPIIAADRRQARTVFRYVLAFLHGVPMLRQMITHETRESVELSNRVALEVHTASWRTLRGYTCIGAILDEVAFFRSDEDAANPDDEILAGLRPSMATVPGALLLGISSPYARRGVLWDAYSKHFAKDGDPVLVWQGDTASMNPRVDSQIIADAYEADEATAAAEYGAQWRTDVEAFISAAALQAVTIPGREELPPNPRFPAMAFCDPAGGTGKDSFALAVGHRELDRIIVDKVVEIRPPFDPDVATREMAAVLRAYGVRTVVGDKYAGAWPTSRFAAHGIRYEESDRVRSDLYRDALPVITAKRCELPDLPRLYKQWLSLDRTISKSGRETIDAGRGRLHDDLSNVTAGLLVQLGQPRPTLVQRPGGW